MSNHENPVEMRDRIAKIWSDNLNVKYKYDILKDREANYGNPVEMHERIAKIWSGILNVKVDAYEVALCMAGLKLARATKNADDPDSLIDAHGYAEIAQIINENKKEV